MKSILFLGPYGNLTTLYASILTLHPSIIGLNHARDRIPPEAMFYDGQNISIKYNNFINFVLDNQQRSDIGHAGGSFEKAHASRKGELKELEDISTYTSKNPTHFVWKESGFLTSQLRQNACIKRILEEIPGAVFIRPIRNPLHWLKTNLIAQHFELYDDTWGKGFVTEAQASSPIALSQWYLRDLQWFLRLREQYSHRFIIHFETQPFDNIVKQLNLQTTDLWLEIANAVAGKIRHRECDLHLAEVFNSALAFYAGDAYSRITADFIAPVLAYRQ